LPGVQVNSVERGKKIFQSVPLT